MSVRRGAVQAAATAFRAGAGVGPGVRVRGARITGQNSFAAGLASESSLVFHKSHNVAQSRQFTSFFRSRKASPEPRGARSKPVTQWLMPPLKAVRAISGRPLPQQRSPLLNFAYRSAALVGTGVGFIGLLLAAFFLYDATTYKESITFGDCDVSSTALNPPRGGPKNLPIIEAFLDDDESEQARRNKDKPRLVILGGGWGSVALLKQLNPDDYHVTVVSPKNYFLFTPMLPSATVGTLEMRSLVEPIRRILTRVHGHFLRASAEDVEFSHKLVECSQRDAQGNEVRFYVPYDKLVIAVGSVTNPHGVKGLENCFFLKDIVSTSGVFSFTPKQARSP